MQHTTRNKFFAAAVAGVITCGGAIATATASNADSSASPGATGSSTSATGTPTTGPPTSGTGSSAPNAEYAAVTPVINVLDNGRVKIGFHIKGVIFAGSIEPIQYTSHDLYVDGKHYSVGDGAVGAPDMRLRPIDATMMLPYEGDSDQVLVLAPGTHLLTGWVSYPTSRDDGKAVQVRTTFTVGGGSATPTVQPPSTTSTNPDEPPTPSPKTTQLGVTG